MEDHAGDEGRMEQDRCGRAATAMANVRREGNGDPSGTSLQERRRLQQK